MVGSRNLKRSFQGRLVSPFHWIATQEMGQPGQWTSSRRRFACPMVQQSNLHGLREAGNFPGFWWADSSLEAIPSRRARCGRAHSAFRPAQLRGSGSLEVLESSSARLSKLGRFSIMVCDCSPSMPTVKKMSSPGNCAVLNPTEKRTC